MPVEYSPSITSARIIPSLLRCPPERGKITGMDLARVDTELAGQFANRAIALECRQGHLRLERCAVLLPGLLH